MTETSIHRHFKHLDDPRLDRRKKYPLINLIFCENQLALGQQIVSGKSNEITAIPLLFDLLDLEGATVTIDAMGCQKEISEKIRCLALVNLVIFATYKSTNQKENGEIMLPETAIPVAYFITLFS